MSRKYEGILEKKIDLYFLREVLLAIEITGKDHSDISCRNYTGRLVTLDKSPTKFKAAYKYTRVQPSIDS